jgi:hypothetical protein
LGGFVRFRAEPEDPSGRCEDWSIRVAVWGEAAGEEGADLVFVVSGFRLVESCCSSIYVSKILEQL